MCLRVCVNGQGDGFQVVFRHNPYRHIPVAVRNGGLCSSFVFTHKLLHVLFKWGIFPLDMTRTASHSIIPAIDQNEFHMHRHAAFFINELVFVVGGFSPKR